MKMMDVLSTNCSFRIKHCHLPNLHSSFGEDKDICGKNTSSRFSINPYKRYSGNVKGFATRKLRRRERILKKDEKDLVSGDQVENDDVEVDSSLYGDVIVGDESGSNLDVEASVASRGDVIRACTVTSGLMVAAGLLLREVSHIASNEGWPIIDCSSGVNFHFEFWHLELIAGSVVLVSTCRFLLLKAWPNFAESSEAANRQILTSLEPLDYLIVAFLPGISEEILFRGALLPLFGVSWLSIIGVASLFGILHLGSGRKYSFAIWATFVGLVYGYATMLSSSMIVPMASHALNNLIGGIIWRYTSESSKIG